MKTKITTLVCILASLLGNAQDQNINTKSVSIENLITFIVDHIENKTEDSGEDPEHYIFLLQTPFGDLIAEDKVILKQAFKLISKRLSTEDHLSLIAYSGLNGIALNRASAKDLKGITYTLEHLKSSIKEPQKDGIEVAYTFAESTKEEDVQSTIVMIRNPKAMIARASANPGIVNSKTTENPKKGNAVWLTAITLLPQIISVIKD